MKHIFIFIPTILFSHLKRIMDENREMLIELDSVMGDSDLGITMHKAFNSAHTEAQGFTGKEAGQLMFNHHLLYLCHLAMG